MPLVHFALRRYVPQGVAPARGRIRCEPDRRVTRDKRIWVPAPFDVIVDQGGEADIMLESTRQQFAWRVTILPESSPSFTRVVEVPESADHIDFVDLLDVDPDTMVPPSLSSGPYMDVYMASDDDDAYAYSQANPDTLVLYKLEGA